MANQFGVYPQSIRQRLQVVGVTLRPRPVADACVLKLVDSDLGHDCAKRSILCIGVEFEGAR